MIEYISGKLAEVSPTTAVIDCMGIGYEINITLIDYTAMQNMDEVKLYIEESIREDAHTLYGFLTRRGRELFRLLIGVSGVGPNSARLIMSAMTPADLESVIASGDDRALKAVKGIGAKTAQRIIVDLKDKIKPDAATLINRTTINSGVYEEALSALIMLGFTKVQSEKVLKKVFAIEPETGVEKAIKAALKML